MTYTLVLLRHGESDWNAKNLFTGWVDVPLSDKGRAEAETGGRLLAGEGLLPDVVHTSLLRRAISTASWVPLSGWIRPNTTRSSPPAGSNGSASRSMPWYTVAT